MSNEEIKDCPFCGNPATLSKYHTVGCTICGVWVSKDRADVWNQRAALASREAGAPVTKELRDAGYDQANKDHTLWMETNEHYRERVFNQIEELDAAAGLKRFCRTVQHDESNPAFVAGMRLAHEQALKVTHALMAERDEWKAKVLQLVQQPVAYISKTDLVKLRDCNHLLVGLDSPNCWPIGPGESIPYDHLVALFTEPSPLNNIQRYEFENIDGENSYIYPDENGTYVKFEDVVSISSKNLKHVDEGALAEQAEAWNAVSKALSKYYPEWHTLTNRGMDSAVEAIKLMADRLDLKSNTAKINNVKEGKLVIGFDQHNNKLYADFNKKD